MSDFLTRLAERALGHGHVVEPLLPSLWESAPLVEDGLPDAPVGEGSTRDLTATSNITGRVAPASEQPAPGEVSPPAATADTPLSPPLRPAARVERETARPDLSQPPLVHSTPPSLVPAGIETTVTREQVEHLERVEVHTTGPGAVIPDTTAPRETARAATRATAMSPTAAPAPLLPHIVEPPEELHPLTAAVSTAAPATRVEITIGRVDVRAVSKSWPVQKPQRPAAAPHDRLSLQDYLAAGTEKRGGGRP